jgi:hypothetical protein
MFNGEEAVLGYLAGFDTELTDGLVQKKSCTTYMTSGAHAHSDNVFPTRFKFKSLIEGGHPIDLNNGYTQIFRYVPHGLLRYISTIFLYVVQYFN